MKSVVLEHPIPPDKAGPGGQGCSVNRGTGMEIATQVGTVLIILIIYEQR